MRSRKWEWSGHVKFAKKEFKDDQSRILECERCEGHYCAKCVKLSENEYDMISAREDFHWYCVGCEPKVLQSIQIEKEVEKKLTEFMAKVECKVGTLEGNVYKKITDFEEKLGKSNVNIALTGMLEYSLSRSFPGTFVPENE